MSDTAADMSGKPSNYYEGRRQDMLKYIPPSVRKVLELGCARGYFCELVKQTFGAECWGVEINPQIARSAATRLDRVINADVNEAMAQVPDGYFDCIVCNDILEHLADPYSLLIRLKAKLAPAGVVVASLPNVRYCTVLYHLVISGTWDYKDSGILDRTHLRFFTYKSLVKMWRELGYELVTIEGLEPEPSGLSRLVKFVNLLLLNRFKDTIYHHFACVARPKEQP